MEWLLLLGWLSAAAALGCSLSHHILHDERRRFVHLCFSLPVGHAIQGIVLVFLWSFIPPGTAFYPTVALSVLAAIFLWRLDPAIPRNLSWGISPVAGGAVAIALAASGFLAHRVFTIGYLGWSAEALYLHSGLVGWLSRLTYPPTGLLEPDDPLRYRFGLHVIASAVSSQGALPPEALAATLATTIPLGALALIGASLRLTGGIGTGVLAWVLGTVGGSLLPYERILGWAMSGVEPTQARELITGLLFPGNMLDMAHRNPTVIAGFAAFCGALWITWETIGCRKLSILGSITISLVLAFLGLVNEVFFVALGCGLIGSQALMAFTSRERLQNLTRCAQSVAVLITAYGIVGLRGGLMGGIAVAGTGADSVQMVLNIAQAGSVPTAPSLYGAQWVPLVSADALLDIAFLPILLPILSIASFRARDRYTLAGGCAALAAMAGWLTVYPRQSPSDGYRLGQAAFAICLVTAPFALLALKHYSHAIPKRLLRVAMAAGLALLLTPHLLLIGAVSLFPLSSGDAVTGPDRDAAAYLRGSSGSWRVLVPMERPDQHWGDLYLNSDGMATTRVILGISGHAVPMGFVPYFNPGRYLTSYRQASLDFSRSDLAELKIDWVFVLPARLTREQGEALKNAVARGDVAHERTFGQVGSATERVLLRVKRGT